MRVALRLLPANARSGPPSHVQNYDNSLIPHTESTNRCDILETVRGCLGQIN